MRPGVMVSFAAARAVHERRRTVKGRSVVRVEGRACITLACRRAII